MTESHATPEAGDAHDAPAGHDDHDDTPLGPVDAQAWGAGILGVAVGALVAILLYAVSYH